MENVLFITFQRVLADTVVSSTILLSIDIAVPRKKRIIMNLAFM